jgi:hypothetical protein
MYFGMKNYLKSTRNHTAKHALYILALTMMTWDLDLYTHTQSQLSLKKEKKLR